MAEPEVKDERKSTLEGLPRVPAAHPEPQIISQAVIETVTKHGPETPKEPAPASEVNSKTERDSTLEPEIEQDSSYDRADLAPTFSRAPTQEDPTSVGVNHQSDDVSRSRFTWQQSGTYSPRMQVEIREKAVTAGVQLLENLMTQMKLFKHDVPSTSRWIERIETIKSNSRECRVLVGFLGTTGAGKSSLINAVLEQEDLLPADDEKACTAVCVEISWNHMKDQGGLPYRAIIERISKDDWRVELENLFKDVDDQAQNKDGDDGEPDLERDLRIKTALQKLKCVYPRIKSPADLKNRTVDSLLIHKNVKSLGTTMTLAEDSRKRFSAKIRPFIDSSYSRDGKTGNAYAQWPLVKRVRLYVVSSVLEHGIALVDLPGSMDTNAARGAIAEEYQKNLSVSCVIAQITRAISDKPAQDLLGKISQRNLQLDNKFSAEHLCFIVSKTDVSLNMARYINTHKNVQAALAGEFEKEAIIRAALQRSLDNYNETIAAEAEKKESSKLVKKEIKELKQLPSVEKYIVDSLTSGKKRKRNEDLPDTKNSNLILTAEDSAQIETLRKLQKSLKSTKGIMDRILKKQLRGTRKIQKLENAMLECERRKMAVCIKNRNSISKLGIRKDFEATRKEMGFNGSSKPLPVFCVSSWAFSDHSKEKKSIVGFPRKEDTGIPELQKWLNSLGLPSRDRNALAFLEDLVSLELSMAPWLAGESVEYKLSGVQRNNIANLFAKRFQNLKEALSKINTEATQRCESILEKELFPALLEAEKRASELAEQTVRGWSQKPMHWSSHRAANRGQGTWKTRGGFGIMWNDQLAGTYLSLIVKQWDRTLYRYLPAQRPIYDAAVEAAFHEFVTTVGSSISEMCPDLSQAVQTWTESSLRSIMLIRKLSLRVFEETVVKVARDAHRLVLPIINGIWKPVYDICGEETGHGLFKRNQERHIAHVQTMRLTMYSEATSSIKNSFKKLLRKLPAAFEKGCSLAISQIREDFEEMLENQKIRYDQEDSKSPALLKSKLREIARGLIATMKVSWSEVPCVTPIKDEDFEAEEEIDIEKLLKDDDSDDEDSEVSEEESDDD